MVYWIFFVFPLLLDLLVYFTRSNQEFSTSKTRTKNFGYLKHLNSNVGGRNSTRSSKTRMTIFVKMTKARAVAVWYFRTTHIQLTSGFLTVLVEADTTAEDHICKTFSEVLASCWSLYNWIIASAFKTKMCGTKCYIAVVRVKFKTHVSHVLFRYSWQW